MSTPFDQSTYPEIPRELAQEGRRLEIEKMKFHEAFEVVSLEQLRGKKIGVKWVEEVRKRDDGTAFKRCRLVGKEVAYYALDDVNAGTPPLCMLRLIRSFATITSILGRTSWCTPRSTRSSPSRSSCRTMSRASFRGRSPSSWTSSRMRRGMRMKARAEIWFFRPSRHHCGRVWQFWTRDGTAPVRRATQTTHRCHGRLIV